MRALCAALLLAWPAYGQSPLTPSPELAAKLEELEARRVPVEAAHARALGLRLGAAAGYTVALTAGIWSVAELIASATQKHAEPLAGGAHRTVVPAGTMAAIGLGFAVSAVVLHVAARMLDDLASREDEDLAEAERDLRWKYRPRDAED
jgi:hypothetical protein